MTTVGLLLADPRVDLEARNANGHTCLHQAACSDSHAVVEAISAASARLLDARNRWGEAPLHLAATANSAQSASALLKAGASQQAVDAWGRTPAQVAAEQGGGAVRIAFGLTASGSELAAELSRVSHPDAGADRRSALHTEFMERLHARTGEGAEAARLEAAATSVVVRHMFADEADIEKTGSSQPQSSPQEPPPPPPPPPPHPETQPSPVPKVGDASFQSLRAHPASTGTPQLLPRGQDVPAKASSMREEMLQRVVLRQAAASAPLSAKVASPPRAASRPAGPTLPALSKRVEYQATVEDVQAMLAGGEVDAAGRDFYGLTALHKFAGWNRVDLTEVLLERLGDEDVNAIGGARGQTALHHCVEMGAWRTLPALLRHRRTDAAVTDGRGMTPREFAVSMGLQDEFDAAAGGHV